MTLNGVIARFATGTYVVTRTPAAVYTDGRLVAADTIELDSVTVDATTDTLTKVAHGLVTEDGPVHLLTEGTVPGGLAEDVDYWVIRLTDDTFQLATSQANALAGTEIDITDDGAESFSITSTRYHMLASIQPMEGRALESLPETDRTSEVKLVLTEFALRDRRPGFEPDSISYKGESWTCIRSEEWEHWGATHYRCAMTRDEVT